MLATTKVAKVKTTVAAAATHTEPRHELYTAVSTVMIEISMLASTEVFVYHLALAFVLFSREIATVLIKVQAEDELPELVE